MPDPPGSGAELLRADPATGRADAAAEVAAILVGAAEPGAAEFAGSGHADARAVGAASLWVAVIAWVIDADVARRTRHGREATAEAAGGVVGAAARPRMGYRYTCPGGLAGIAIGPPVTPADGVVHGEADLRPRLARADPVADALWELTEAGGRTEGVAHTGERGQRAAVCLHLAPSARSLQGTGEAPLEGLEEGAALGGAGDGLTVVI